MCLSLEKSTTFVHILLFIILDTGPDNDKGDVVEKLKHIVYSKIVMRKNLNWGGLHLERN